VGVGVKKNTWVELDLDLLSENITSLRSALSDDSEIIFVVKADAYGHGIVPVSTQARKCGVKWFAVAHVYEAIELRSQLPDAEIIVMGVADAADVSALIENNCVAVVVSEEHGQVLSASALTREGALRCHIKVDSGMSRLGIGWEGASDAIARLVALEGLDVEGACSHFAASDSSEGEFTEIQVERFRSVMTTCKAAGTSLPFTHVANSGGILSGQEYDFEGVRPGILLYGYRGRDTSRDINVRPFLTWKTTVLQVKELPAGVHVGYDCTYTTEADTCVAILDVGYADGYPRSLSNRGHVIVAGKVAPVVGRVSMNFVAVELGASTEVKPGDEVVLIGCQGSKSITVDELAGWAETIRYEILTNIRTDDHRVTDVRR
jgi:alanine racemase